MGQLAANTAGVTNQNGASGVTHPNGAETKKKLSFKEQREYETLETDIAVLEQHKVALTELMSAGEHHEQLTTWANEITKTDGQIQAKSDRWLELAEYI